MASSETAGCRSHWMNPPGRIFRDASAIGFPRPEAPREAGPRRTLTLEPPVVREGVGLRRRSSQRASFEAASGRLDEGVDGRRFTRSATYPTADSPAATGRWGRACAGEFR